MSSNRELIE